MSGCRSRNLAPMGSWGRVDTGSRVGTEGPTLTPSRRTFETVRSSSPRGGRRTRDRSTSVVP